MAKKPRRSAAGYQRRRVDTREVRQRFLIFCEGEKTETTYFESFRAPHVVVRVAHGGSDPLRLVDEASQRRESERSAGPDKKEWDKQNQVWCVFDRDNVEAGRFRQALERAAAGDLRVAYSNPKFEVWLLLHFEICGGGLAPPEYDERLGRWLGRSYRKNDVRLYDALEARQAEAIARAERLLATYDPCDPANDAPCTTVHLLVQALRRFAAP